MFNIFINFKPNATIPYGGGNITTYYLEKYFENQFNNFQITYELSPNIHIYLIIDPFKDNKFKKYSLEDVINHRNSTNPNGKIVIRVNDCDITRPNAPPSRSREKAIIKNISNINHFIFNSNFIKSHYHKLSPKYINNNFTIIHNGCDISVFFPQPHPLKKPFNIVTHHWSNNMNKGYKNYYELWKIFKRIKNFNFTFIGQNVPEMFEEVPIIGPFVGSELSKALTDCDFYITDSIYDSCPNHVIEAISCGLPILYRNHEGGAKELCELFPDKIGESYDNMEDLLDKIILLKRDYLVYKSNIMKYSKYFEFNKQIAKYKNTFLSIINSKVNHTLHSFENNGNYSITLQVNHKCNMYLKINSNLIPLESDTTYQINTRIDCKKIFLVSRSIKNKFTVKKLFVNSFNDSNKYKLNNNNINVLYSSDSAYFIPMFSSLNSVIKNSKLNNIHFNFIIPLQDYDEFYYKSKNFKINKSVVIIDKDIIDKNILESKCYNGGNHLLNIGNFSRLMIGEFFTYEKLLYLDSDSICKCDLDFLKDVKTKDKYFSAKANRINTNKKKQIVLQMKQIIDETYCKKVDINTEEYVYFGAPFLTDCKIWKDAYNIIIKLVKDHNKIPIYKLFTMSLQNLLFYGKTEDLYPIIKTLPDLGSKRKEWDTKDFTDADILDWSGIYKPWFNNGLYKDQWQKYNIFDKDFGDVKDEKNTVENFV